MAILSDADREQIWKEFMERHSSLREPIAVTKSDLRVAVNAVDTWVEANKASFNAALPEPAKSNLSAKIKAALLTFVVERRWEAS